MQPRMWASEEECRWEQAKPYTRSPSPSGLSTTIYGAPYSGSQHQNSSCPECTPTTTPGSYWIAATTGLCYHLDMGSILRGGEQRIVPVIRMNDYDRVVWIMLRLVSPVVGTDEAMWNWEANIWENLDDDNLGTIPPKHKIELTPEVARHLSGEFTNFARKQGWEPEPEHAKLLETENKLLRQELEFLRNTIWEVASGFNRTKAEDFLVIETPVQDEQQGSQKGPTGSGSTRHREPKRAGFQCLSSLPGHQVGKVDEPKPVWEEESFDRYDAEGADGWNQGRS